MAGFLSAVSGVAAIPTTAPSRVVVAAPAIVAPVAAPKPYPIAPPLDQEPYLDPVLYPSPFQNRGDGGVPFTVAAGLEKLLVTYQVPRLLPTPRQPLTDPMRPTTAGPVTYPSPDVKAYNPAAPAPTFTFKQPLGGARAVMPVPVGQQPTRVAVAPTVDKVPIPGPISGKIGGLDLSVIPWWGWALGGLLLVRALVH